MKRAVIWFLLSCKTLPEKGDFSSSFASYAVGGLCGRKAFR